MESIPNQKQKITQEKFVEKCYDSYVYDLKKKISEFPYQNLRAQLLNYQNTIRDNQDLNPKPKIAAIFFYGTFCPIHYGHIDLMIKAEQYVKSLNSHDVVCGYISGCHPNYLHEKLRNDAIPSSTRDSLIKLAINSDPELQQTWEFDQYMSNTMKFKKNSLILKKFHQRLNASVKNIIQEINEQKIDENQERQIQYSEELIEIYWIMGMDWVEYLKPDLVKRNYHLVYVDNREVNQYIEEQSMELESLRYPYKSELQHRIHLVKSSPLNISSTQIRKAMKISDELIKRAELMPMLRNEQLVNFIIEKRLFQDFPNSLLNFKPQNLTNPKLRSLSELKNGNGKIFTQDILKPQTITKIFRDAKLIKEDEEIQKFSHRKINQDIGFSGCIFRLEYIEIQKIESSLLEQNDQEELKQPINSLFKQNELIILPHKSYILKVCSMTEEMFRLEDESFFLTYIGEEFTNPLFPSNYVSYLRDWEFNQRKQKTRYVMLMEDLYFARNVSFQSGMKLNQLLHVIENLAQFQAYWWENPKLKSLVNSKHLMKADDLRLIGIFKRNFSDFKLMLRPERYSKLIEVVNWLESNLENYFKILAQDPMTICHGDFTIRNFMIALNKNIPIEHADLNLNCTIQDNSVYMIDWQTVMIGNGLVDLSFLLYYGIDLSFFQSHENFEGQMIEFYFQMLIKYGVSKFQLTLEKVQLMFKRGFYLGFMRMAMGSGPGFLFNVEACENLDDYDGWLDYDIQRYMIFQNQISKAIEIFDQRDQIFGF